MSYARFTVAVFALCAIGFFGSISGLASESGGPGPQTAAAQMASDPAGDTQYHSILVEKGQTIADFPPLQNRAYDEYADLDPGLAPEGDGLGNFVFTQDGNRILATNRETDNVTVFDWATMSQITTIDVGNYPQGIATTDLYAVVACAFSDEVYIIDLSDYSIASVIPTGEQPWVVKISPDQATAYVACDIDDVCEVINLQALTHSHTIPDFPISLLSWGGAIENARTTVKFTNFKVSPDNAYLLAADREDSFYFINTTTGNKDYTISGIVDGSGVALSGDGTKAVVLGTTTPAGVYQIDLVSHSLTGTVMITDNYISSSYVPGVNADGSKAFIGVGGNQSAIARFATSDFIYIASTNTPYWIGVSPDHSYAVGGQYRFSIIDFDTETLLGQHQGNSQSTGAVSPVGHRAIGGDPLRFEGGYFYDYTTVSSPVYRGRMETGSTPEGDCPRRVAITPDGSKAVVSNLLSGTVSIVNLDTYLVEAILFVGYRAQNVAITSDGLTAVVAGLESHSVSIIDLMTNSIVAEVPTGSRPGALSITPDDQYAYVGNIQANTISVVELAGAASYEVTEFYCGIIGVTLAANYVPSGITASPAGDYVLSAASFDDQVKVIDTTTHSIVASLPVGVFPLQIAFNGAGDYATVTNYNGDTYSTIHVDGASSSVVGTFNAGDGPLRLAYNLVGDEIGIGNYSQKTLIRVDPETGAFIDGRSFSDYGGIIQVKYDDVSGKEIVLTGSYGNFAGHLHYGSEAIPLPVSPSYFDYVGPGAIIPGPNDRSSGSIAVVTMPGPDVITVVKWESSGAPEVVTIPLGEAGLLHNPQPNIIHDSSRFGFSLARAGNVQLSLIDVGGRKVASLGGGYYNAGRHELTWRPAKLPSGVYHAILEMRGQRLDSKRVLVIE